MRVRGQRCMVRRRRAAEPKKKAGIEPATFSVHCNSSSESSVGPFPECTQKVPQKHPKGMQLLNQKTVARTLDLNFLITPDSGLELRLVHARLPLAEFALALADAPPMEKAARLFMYRLSLV
jgi:hypothetical protein